MGLLKKVWSKKPESASAPPSRTAAAARGSRTFQRMPRAVSLPPRPRRSSTTSRAGSRTLPSPTFSSASPTKSAKRTATVAQ